MKVVINFIEIGMIYYSLKARNTFQDKEVGLKVLCVGLAWSFAEAVCSYLLYFLMNATGEEFKWEYIQVAIQSNIDLVDRIAVVALVECYKSLREHEQSNTYILVVLVLKYLVFGLAFRYVDLLKHECSWKQLMIKGGCTVTFALATK